jgi:hypothetical protein
MKLHLATPFEAISNRTKFFFGKVGDLLCSPLGSFGRRIAASATLEFFALLAVGISGNETFIANKRQGSVPS